MRQNGRTILADLEKPALIKAVQMEVIHFFDARAANPDGSAGHEVVILYSLGSDGVIREFVNGKWVAFPIT